jgi:hypothetical protein
LQRLGVPGTVQRDLCRRVIDLPQVPCRKLYCCGDRTAYLPIKN